MILLKRGNLLTPGQLVSFGVPHFLQICIKTSLSFSPVNKISPVIISQKTHPTLQMSTAGPYSVSPKSN